MFKKLARLPEGKGFERDFVTSAKLDFSHFQNPATALLLVSSTRVWTFWHVRVFTHYSKSLADSRRSRLALGSPKSQMAKVELRVGATFQTAF